MANDITGNPWIIRDVGLISAGSLTFLKMIFYADVAGDDLSLYQGETNGTAFWFVRAVSAAQNYEDYAGVPFEPCEPMTVENLTVGTIDGGELWVWLK